MSHDLPQLIPLFPLPNFVLYPGVEVPLHIFEPRYRQMIADVSGDHGIIGMTLLRGEWEKDYYGHPDTFAVGCAGRITKLVQLPDGRYNLILAGLHEFRIIRELRERAYRQAYIEWKPALKVAAELDEKTLRSLRRLLVDFGGASAEQAWRSIVEERGVTGAQLINFLCFYLDLTSLEKQTLLEALDRRVSCLVDILTFKLAERGAGGDGNGSGTVQ